MNDLLNPNQLRSVAIVLKMFEENLRMADFWLQGAESNGIQYRDQLNLSQERQRMARQLIASSLDEITALASQLGLEFEAADPAAIIRSQMSIAWANLIDSQASKLTRYGDVLPGVVEELDPSLQRLAHNALTLSRLFENHSSNPASSDAENLNNP